MKFEICKFDICHRDPVSLIRKYIIYENNMAPANVNGDEDASVNSDPNTSVSATHFSLSLPESLSPCANVRRSCSSLMKDKPFNVSGNIIDTSTRSVIIDPVAMNDLAEKITQSILEKYTTNKKEKDWSSNKRQKRDFASTEATLDKCIDSLDFASWDADGWHYTGSNYSRPHLSKELEERQRFERVALYVMIMDCINFCFWPVEDENEKGDGKGDINHCGKLKTNLLEYEHLATALKKISEADDVLPPSSSEMESTAGRSNVNDITSIQAENSYALAPQNLINLKVETFLDLIELPTEQGEEVNEKDKNQNTAYIIPNARERTRLIIELCQSLLTFHNGSATHLISKANQSADTLVYMILQSFPGFRDTAVHDGRFVAFYKRAQILVADLWAALGKVQDNTATCVVDYCCFNDMENITTFADYRVPQLLRHLGVLQYSPNLAQQVDQQIEILPFSADELYIRAATVVAVDELVRDVRMKLQNNTMYQKLPLKEILTTEVNAVKMDWYLWNIGEKLDRNKTLGHHHRVKTIFY